MNFNAAIKDKISQLLREGNREQASVFLQQELTISEEVAEKLLVALEKENPRDYVIKPLVTKGFKTFAGGPTGCVSLVLKGFMVFFGLITLTLYGFAIILNIYYYIFSNNAAHVTGTVIELKLNNEGSAAPLVEYTWQGNVKTYQSSMYSDPPDYVLYDPVPVLVNPENPDDILIDSFTERYLISVILASIGTFFLLLTIVLNVVSKKIRTAV